MYMTILRRENHLLENFGMSATKMKKESGSGIRMRRQQQQQQQQLNGEQVQKLLSYRRFVRAAGLGPREFAAGVRDRAAIEASQAFDEDGLTVESAGARAASRRGDGARKRYRTAHPTQLTDLYFR